MLEMSVISDLQDRIMLVMLYKGPARYHCWTDSGGILPTILADPALGKDHGEFEKICISHWIFHFFEKCYQAFFPV